LNQQASSCTKSKNSKTHLTDLSNPSDIKKHKKDPEQDKEKFTTIMNQYRRNPKRSQTDVCRGSRVLSKTEFPDVVMEEGISPSNK
jgi:hypothetical protein